MQTTPTDTVVARLRQRVRTAAHFTAQDVDKLRVVLGDALGLALEAGDSPFGAVADRLVAAAPSGPAAVVGAPRRVATESAVLANSIRIHALLRDDAHAGTLLHPAAVVIPVALAVAEETGADASAFLAAVVGGYDALVAVATPVADRTAERGFRNTAVFGPIGAAVAAAVLLGLDDDGLERAMLIASGSAGGTLQSFRAGAPDWRFQPGLAGQMGVAAARLAVAAGASPSSTPRNVIESPVGLYATLGVEAPEWRTMIGPRPTALHEVSHKVHATCGANQMPVAALTALLAGGIVVDDIERIDIELSQSSYSYPGCEDHGPFHAGATFLSRPLAMAATALAGPGILDAARVDAALTDPRLNEVARRVRSHVVADDRLSSPQDAWVEIRLRDGSVRRAGPGDIDPGALQPEWPAIADRLRERHGETGARLVAALTTLQEVGAAGLLATMHPVRPTQEES